MIFNVAGEIFAFVNTKPTSLESYRQPQHKALQGKFLVIIKAKKLVGRITLTAKLAGLKSSSVNIEAK